MLSFGWAMANRSFIERANGFYYDLEKVRYCRSQKKEQYTHKHVTSILHGDLDSDHVPSPLADTMVTRALDYVNTNIPPELQELIEGEMFAGDIGEEVETQSS